MLLTSRMRGSFSALDAVLDSAADRSPRWQLKGGAATAATPAPGPEKAAAAEPSQPRACSRPHLPPPHVSSPALRPRTRGPGGCVASWAASRRARARRSSRGPDPPAVPRPPPLSNPPGRAGALPRPAVARHFRRRGGAPKPVFCFWPGASVPEAFESVPCTRSRVSSFAERLSFPAGLKSGLGLRGLQPGRGLWRHS